MGLLCAHVSSITWQKMGCGWGWHTARPVKLPPPPTKGYVTQTWGLIPLPNPPLVWPPKLPAPRTQPLLGKPLFYHHIQGFSGRP